MLKRMMAVLVAMCALQVGAADFRHVIRKAYQDILQRDADTGGLDHYNGLMNATPALTEAGLREHLMRSTEYASRFPGPTPSPVPTPPPTGSMAPLRVQGNQFTAGGQPIKLLGMIICCGDPLAPESDGAVARGWPSIVDDRTLDFMAANKFNFVHVRTGPFKLAVPGSDDSGETPENIGYAIVGDKVDLTRWNPAFFTRLRTFLGSARTRKLYAEVDLIDTWVIDHGETTSPLHQNHNVNGVNLGTIEIYDSPPQPIHEAWIRKVVQETKDFENVIYHTGNEMWKARNRAHISTWVRRMAEIVREETGTGPARRLLGDNSNTRHPLADYWTYHKNEAQEADEKPVMVNEYPSQPPHVVVAEAARAQQLGTAFHYWRGDHKWPEVQGVGAQLKTLIEGGQPFPPSCPRLVRWQPKVHIVMNRHRQLIESGVPEEGGFVFNDSTPRYGGGNGAPCNAEHNVVCGGRPCEDPRGGRWTLVEGSVQVRVENPGDNGLGYQTLVGPLGPPGSRYTLRVEALPDAQDSLGVSLDVAPNHARTVTFTVGESTRSATALAVGGRETFRPIPERVKRWMETGQWK